MTATDFTLEELEQVKAFWWSAACGRGLFPRLLEVASKHNPGNGLISLDNNIKIHMQTACGVGNDGTIDGTITVFSDGGAHLVVDTHLRIFVPGDWETTINDAYAKLKADEQAAVERKLEERANTLRKQLLLHQEGGCNRIFDALKVIRGLRG